jgi:hypothetical protein
LAWLWPSRVRRPASLMMIWNTPASAIPSSLATSGETAVVSLIASARVAAWRSASSSASRWTAGLMAARYPSSPRHSSAGMLRIPATDRRTKSRIAAAGATPGGRERIRSHSRSWTCCSRSMTSCSLVGK